MCILLFVPNCFGNYHENGKNRLEFISVMLLNLSILFIW